ncbi:39S ribosomal protein L51, mitochondrial-like [Penaeus japonicus]|uniref:39S ribosomal protein L51, mitochondrial-like n=1 Tax=Penaeus japonicus TaxID=27405 RepID=UPI001C71000B|nr:39S ribosomal protein L51, mitochondrial-like [Penaeus japonicus]
MATIAGSLMRSLGAVAQSMAQAAPTALRGVSQGLAARVTPSGATWTPQTTSVRHRYHADKLERGPLMKNYGYEEKLHTKGMLPHIVHGKRLPIPMYRPRNCWSEKRALFGQNDYIDILGDRSLKPTDVSYSVPHWLRGFKGNEYQMLLRKRKLFHAQMSRYQPTKLTQLNKRIRKLYVHLNQKTRDYYWHKA